MSGRHGGVAVVRERARGMDSLCWFAPGALRRLFELPAPVLSRHQLKRLEEHRYSSSGRSLLEPVMQRYWEWLVRRMPPWIAPNLITIVGLATNIFTTLVLVYYCPTATEQVPCRNMPVSHFLCFYRWLIHTMTSLNSHDFCKIVRILRVANSYEFVRMTYAPKPTPSLGFRQIVLNRASEVVRISHLVKYVRWTS